MAECPACFGECGYDLRDSNALLREHLTDAELAHVGGLDRDWADCLECDATGVVTEERRAELLADGYARAMAVIETCELEEALALPFPRDEAPRV